MTSFRGRLWTSFFASFLPAEGPRCRPRGRAWQPRPLLTRRTAPVLTRSCCCGSVSGIRTCKTRFYYKILLDFDWLRLLMYLHIVLCERAPTPGSLRFAKALPTSHCVTPSLIRLCLKRSANASNSLGRQKKLSIRLHIYFWYLPGICVCVW